MLARTFLMLLGTSLTLISCEQRVADTTDAERSCPPLSSTPAPTAETVFCADTTTMLLAPVVRVVDGDTIRAKVDGVEEPVRFYGIDTPERGERCFTEATERTKDLVDRQVHLLADARNRDRNGRLLRYVYTEGGLSVDATLIAEGLASAWTEDGALRDPLIELERVARADGVGCLWEG